MDLFENIDHFLQTKTEQVIPINKTKMRYKSTVSPLSVKSRFEMTIYTQKRSFGHTYGIALLRL